jgi:AcrR family transcriptional regulator
MPKVLPEYIELRRRQVVEAAASCFARSGFHRTSMQDICREANLSPGAVYRYFRSKEEIIATMGDEHHQRDMAFIEMARSRSDTLEVFDQLANLFFATLEAGGEPNTCTDVDLYAEALRNDHIRAMLLKSSDAIREAFKDIMSQAQARGEVNPSLDPDAVARVFMALFQGFILQKVLEPDADPWSYVQAVMAMAKGTFWIGPVPETEEKPRRMAVH